MWRRVGAVANVGLVSCVLREVDQLLVGASCPLLVINYLLKRCPVMEVDNIRGVGRMLILT